MAKNQNQIDFNIDEFDNDDSAAQAMLKKGFPIFYSDGHGHIIREYPNGRKELTEWDWVKDEAKVIKVLHD